MPKLVVYANFLPFVAMLALLSFIKINPLFNKRQNKLFFQTAILILVMLTAISIDYIVQGNKLEGAWLVRTITSFLTFSGSTFVPVFLIRIFTNQTMKPLLYVPCIVNVLLCAASTVTRLVFYFPKEGGYERGPLFFVPFLTTIIYIVALLVLSFQKRQEGMREAFLLFFTMLALCLAMYLEIAQQYNFLSWDIAAVILVLYYLLLNVNRSMLDPLTEAYNRALYTQRIESINHTSRCLIAMIDINGFKTINDLQGHDEGDRVLIQCVKTMKRFMDSKNVLYRIGGDEFVVLSTESTLEAFQKRMADCFGALAQQGLDCAVGYAVYEPELEMEAALQSADVKMYQNKRAYYSSKA